MRTIRRILHPSDFSPASRPAFRKALEMAKAASRRTRGTFLSHVRHAHPPGTAPAFPLRP
jgi:nucleotide-binding universal stress UspA family protein